MSRVGSRWAVLRSCGDEADEPGAEMKTHIYRGGPLSGSPSETAAAQHRCAGAVGVDGNLNAAAQRER